MALSPKYDSNWSRPMEVDDPEFTQNHEYWRKMETVIIHKNYKNEALAWHGFDLALIKMELNNGRGVPKGQIVPACLPGENFDDHNNSSLLMAGFGRRRIPHCLTDTAGPEKFETCGRENACVKQHKTKSCTLNFLDYAGNLINNEVIRYSNNKNNFL